MERRNWSLKALNDLIYIDSLDSYEKADGLVRWNNEYLSDNSIENFDLELKDLKVLEELFHKNLTFLKKHKEETKSDLIKTQKLQKFLENQ